MNALKRRIEVLELFAEISESYRHSQVKQAVGELPSYTPQDIQKMRWADSHRDLQRLYTMRSYYRKRGRSEKMPPINRVKVEIFFDGDGYYFAKFKDSERLAGPLSLHEAWKQADRKHFEVTQVSMTRGTRTYRETK